jgi:hypothetical protein
VVVVVREGAAGEDLPGWDARGRFGKIAKAGWVGQVVVGERFETGQEFVPARAFFGQNVGEGTIAVLGVDDRVPLVFAQVPERRSDQRSLADHPDHLAFAPGDVSDQVLDRRTAGQTGFGHARDRDPRQCRPPPSAGRAKFVEKERSVHARPPSQPPSIADPGTIAQTI